MPKRRKRQEVPFQKKKHRPTKPKHSDHTYYDALSQSEPVMIEDTELIVPDLEPIFVENEELTFRSDLDANDHQVEIDVAEVECIATDKFDELKAEFLKNVPKPFSCSTTSDSLKIFELYPSEDQMNVKLHITVNRNFHAKVFVHRIQLSPDHDLWLGLPKKFDSSSSIIKLLSKLTSYTVCIGNNDQEYLSLVPPGSAVQSGEDPNGCHGYREGDFGAVRGDIVYSSTIRNVDCKLLLQGNRCSPCSHLRRILNSRKHRQEEKRRKSEGSSTSPDYMSRKYKHCNMTKEELIGKIGQQKDKITCLQSEIARRQRQFQREVANNGVELNPCQSSELRDTMAACTQEMEKAFPDANSYQRLFWSEQFKSINVKSTKGMRWHPMIVRWCLYLRQKSNAAYEALRESGFITLPSSRTLFDYSHYTKTGNGYQPDVIEMLREEAEKLDMYNSQEPWKHYVGILFDEIKVKSELVYDKHSGELIGYCNLDKVGNQIMEFEKAVNDSTKSDVAKYLLVVMVRGITSNLKFPLASFPTMSITADFLYPIIWKGIRLIETSVASLKVLFITCDGASANRKFFKIHGEVNDFIHFTENPYSDDNRRIYFISDVPHLIKTTRNCFCNSYAHKNTRKMWKDGKDISWLHLLRLFEDHCELAMYSPCPKLTRQHIDITPFGCMKVNYAAQILSSSVANALELMYGDNVSETINFIRNMNRFFDCMNVRNLFEGRNKRNDDLNPYTSVDDQRLKWLKEDFLKYFKDWQECVTTRPGNFSQKERKGMLLSHQTLLGIEISVNSIVDCVKFMLNAGAKFVMTHSFNQDPLEQQFGHYRHRAGDNNNPRVYDVRHMMTQMRAVGAQALAPSNGNIRKDSDGDKENFVIDNSRLHKR